MIQVMKVKIFRSHHSSYWYNNKKDHEFTVTPSETILEGSAFPTLLLMVTEGENQGDYIYPGDVKILDSKLTLTH